MKEYGLDQAGSKKRKIDTNLKFYTSPVTHTPLDPTERS